MAENSPNLSEDQLLSHIESALNISGLYDIVLGVVTHIYNKRKIKSNKAKKRRKKEKEKVKKVHFSNSNIIFIIVLF